MEHLNNLPPFYIGQKVVYITGIQLPIYTQDTVIDIIKNNCKCCEYLIKVKKHPGEKTIIEDKHPYVRCADCAHIVLTSEWNKTIGYWLASSWRPLQEQTFPLISMKKVLEEQLVCSN